MLTIHIGFAIQERLILKKLKFRLNVATPYVFMLRFLKAAQSDTKVCGNLHSHAINCMLVEALYLMQTRYDFVIINYWLSLFPCGNCSQLEHLAFYLIELCLVQYETLKFKPSLLCASAIYVARCTLNMTPAWTPLLCKHARYEESQLRYFSRFCLFMAFSFLEYFNQFSIRSS